MLTGIIQEGLQDLMIQYLQLKLDFGIKDQVRELIYMGLSFRPWSNNAAMFMGPGWQSSCLGHACIIIKSLVTISRCLVNIDGLLALRIRSQSDESLHACMIPSKVFHPFGLHYHL